MVSSDSQIALPHSLAKQLNQLRQLNTQDIQTTWRWCDHNITAAEIVDGTTFEKISELTSEFASKKWDIAPLNARQHIAWDKGLNIRWLAQTIVVPEHFHGYPLGGLTLRLSLTWWAEDAQIYVDGTLVQSGDLFECFTRILLSEAAQPNDTFQIAIRLVSPNHDDGALVRSHLTYELLNQPTPEPSFIADELTVLATLEPTAQTDIQAALSQLDWDSLTAPLSSPNADKLWQDLSSASPLPPASIHPFQQSLSQLRRTLLTHTPKIKQRTIQCVGHAHLDMAWLWPISDTWTAAERTFRSILNLQQDFPQLTYTHSSPALFEWIEQHRPELFQQIQNKVEDGSWSIDAGLWIEPEFNIIGGEAIVRHILYGQRYCQEKFGSISKIAWLPDSFGFCWQLPQLLVEGGIETFATLKLTWNDTTEFPHQLFWWQSPNGTKIRALMLPPIGTDVDPIKMSDYAAKWERKTQIPNTLWLPGLGDHGGGPTRDMLEKSQRWAESPFFPTLSFTTPEKYVASLPSTPASLPVWNNELYLELHRGCYTTHAKQKQNNRYCEDLLYQAEAFATIAQIVVKQAYPKEQLDNAWKTLLFNQFHDILPGTAIPEVFVEANEGWQQVKQTGETVLNESLSAIASHIKLPPQPDPNATPLIIFNPLAWKRNSVISIDPSSINPTQNHPSWTIYDADHNKISVQNALSLANKKALHAILFSATDIPALGYKCYWLVPSQTSKNKLNKPTSYRLSNQFITASISSTTGEIISLVEKSTNREFLSAPGNQLQLFRDESGYWDAWNIDPNYEQYPLVKPQLISIQWYELGPIQQSIRTTYKTERSTIHQDYILNANSPFLTIDSYIDWNETHVLLKAKFPLSLSAPTATYETAFGAINRTTQPTTAAEKAQWEVPALRWADLSHSIENDNSCGVSILTKAKHGFDAGPKHLRLTLLKSSTWPDPSADRGPQHFTYAIYPHSGTWQSAQTVRHARELNIPAITHSPPSTHHPTLPNTQSFLQVQNPNLILSTLKLSEDKPDRYVLRFYEAHGQHSKVNVTSSLGFSLSENSVEQLNILENNIQLESNLKPDELTYINPYQIVTYRTNESLASDS